MTRLLKYYLDCITEDGTALIGYAARLRIGGLELGYSALMVAAPQSPPAEHTLLGRRSLPALGADAIDWTDPGLDLTGRWEADAPPIQRALLQTGHGAIHWTCLAPRARVTIRHAGATFTGFGYAESLRITLPPWRLPFRELHWGRYTSARHAMVWIEWEGRSTARWLWYDGRSVDGAGSAHGFDLAGGDQLKFLDRRDLRDREVLGALPQALTRFLPADARRLAAMREHKELSAAALLHQGVEQDRGWVIHEVVRW